MAVADDGGYSWNCGKFSGCTLGVTACGDDAGFRVLAVSAADVCAGFAVGFGGDAAGVNYNEIGFVGPGLGGSRSAKESRYRLAIGAGSATAEILDVERRGHTFSLAE